MRGPWRIYVILVDVGQQHVPWGVVGWMVSPLLINVVGEYAALRVVVLIDTNHFVLDIRGVVKCPSVVSGLHDSGGF